MNDITHDANSQNMGGLNKAYFVPLDEVDFTTPPAFDAATQTITGNIVLVALKKWSAFYFTRGTGKLDSNAVGERDGKSWENMAEFNVPGSKPENRVVINTLLRTPGICLLKDSNGNWICVGICKNDDGTLHIDYPAYLETSAVTTGGVGTDKKGSTITLKSESPDLPFYYTGDIDIDAAT